MIQILLVFKTLIELKYIQNPPIVVNDNLSNTSFFTKLNTKTAINNEQLYFQILLNVYFKKGIHKRIYSVFWTFVYFRPIYSARKIIYL